MRQKKTGESGSVLVECIAALVVLTILSAVVFSVVMLSGNLMEDSRRMEAELNSIMLNLERQEGEDSETMALLRFRVRNEAAVEIPARIFGYSGGGTQILVILPCEDEEYEHEDMDLE